jgi:chloramphenicol-sensitive protein RarD
MCDSPEGSLRGEGPSPLEPGRVSQGQRAGLLYAIAAFGFWGLVAVYFKALQHVPAMEVLAHRVLWSVPVTAVLLWAARGWGRLRASLKSPKVFWTLLLSSSLVLVNWFVFIYAIQSGKVMEASLGYYINPLVNVLLGTLFLRERLRRTQAAAVLLAAGGTLNLVILQGAIPWIALILATSFGLYGLIRKTVAIEPVDGLLVETVLMSPLALGYLVWLGFRTEICFALVDNATTVLLALAGAVTAFPLVWFTHAARRLPLSTLGLVQYLAPTLQFLLGVFAYGEPFGWAHLVTFSCIWAGVGIFAAEAWSSRPGWKR